MYYAYLATLNKGVVSVIWGLNPLFIALMDGVLYRQKMTVKHFFGFLSLILCTVAITLTGILEHNIEIFPAQSIVEEMQVPLEVYSSDSLWDEIIQALKRDGFMNYLRTMRRPAWLAVIFGIVTPIGFATNAIFVRFLTKELRFDAKKLQFSAATLMSSITLICALIFWSFTPFNYFTSFNKYLFWWGFFGSIINILGLVSLQFAISRGPAGPISAFISISNVLFTVIESFYNNQGLKLTELVGFSIGFIGVLILVVPELFETIFYFATCQCFKKIFYSCKRRL